MKQKDILWCVNGKICTDNEMKQFFRDNYVQVITDKDEYEKAKEYLIKECNWTEDMFFNNIIVKIKSYNTYIYDDINYRIYDYIPYHWVKLDGDYEKEEIDDMELKDTIELMTSADYKEHFKVEYYQVEIRYEKLKNMYDNRDKLNFTPTCPKEIYIYQLKAMKEYLDMLVIRADIEDIELEIEE